MDDGYEDDRSNLWVRLVRSLFQFECDCEQCEHNVDEEQW